MVIGFTDLPSWGGKTSKTGFGSHFLWQNKFQMDQRFTCKTWNHRHPRRTHGCIFYNPRMGKTLKNIKPKSHKGKDDKIDYIKIRVFYSKFQSQK